MDALHFPDAGLEREILVPGKLSRTVRAHAKDLMLVEVFFEAGAEGAAHAHPHVQATYCVSGRFSFSIGERTFDLGPGDSVCVPGGAEHGVHCLEAGSLLDAFTPRRDDFLKA